MGGPNLLKMSAWFIRAIILLPVLHFALRFNATLKNGDAVAVKDEDGEAFEITRLPGRTTAMNSCYGIRSGSRSRQFCYPSINVVGAAKCATSALYMLFARNPQVVVANSVKEYCIGKNQTVFEYLSGFPHPDKVPPGHYIVNGCIRVDEMFVSIYQLLAPRAALFFSVRNLADRQWAFYNYWCSDEFDINCVDASKQVNDGMYRSPEMFDELLKSSAHIYSRPFVLPCFDMAAYYSKWYKSLALSFGKPPFIIASESWLNSSMVEPTLGRMKDYIAINIGTPLELRAEDMQRVNTGDHHGLVVDNTHSVDGGRYAISGHRPMLQSTRQHIMRCWAECPLISRLTNYPYACHPNAGMESNERV